MPKFVEDATITGTRITTDGYLVADALCARTGIQRYLGSELGRPDLQTVDVYRPPEVVFSKDSLSTYPHKPITNDHPQELVTSDNWKEHASGIMGDEVLRDGEYVRVPLTVMDKKSINDVENGKRELSLGYEMSLDWQEGETPEGEPYQAVMTDYRANHLAIVDKGRAGSKARIGDTKNWGISPLINKDGETPMTVKTQTVVIDGISIETTDQGAQAIEKLQGANSRLEQTIKDNDSAHTEAIKAKDDELEAKQAKIDDLESKVLDEKALDAKVQARADLIATASQLAKDVDFKGMKDADIKKAVVVAIRGEDAVKDKSDAYIQASFDIAADELEKQPVQDAFRTTMKTRTQAQVVDNGQDDYEQRLNDAWKHAEGGQA